MSTAVSLLLCLSFWLFPRGKVHVAVYARGPKDVGSYVYEESRWMCKPEHLNERLQKWGSCEIPRPAGQVSESKIKMNCTDSCLALKGIKEMRQFILSYLGQILPQNMNSKQTMETWIL